MYKFSTSKNFLDILLEPTSIALLASIALHALIAANLSLSIQPDKPGKKGDPGLVKILELSPKELQRIPQAPQPLVQPIPQSKLFPDIIPPMGEPITPIPSPDRATPGKITTALRTIPTSPRRTSPVAKPSSTTQPIPQAQPAAPDFDRHPFSSQPKPSPSSLPSPSNQEPTPTSSQPTPSPGAGDAGNNSQRETNTRGTSTPSPGDSTASTTSPTPVSPDGQSGNGTSGVTTTTTTTTAEGEYRQRAIAKTIEFQRKYPGIKIQKPVALALDYPKGTSCNGVKSAQFIVYMVAFDRVKKPDPILSDSSFAEPIDHAVIGKIEGKASTGEALGTIALQKALEKVQEADNQRSELDRGQQVLYQYKVQYNPSSCKN